MTTTTKIKASIIRRAGYPIGEPAPCFLTCGCGAELDIPKGVVIPCACGAIYSPSGWLLEQGDRP
jgi:hypothetical protein